MLKRRWQKIIREQKGQTLVLVLILMLIGGLLVVPTLNYASTSLKAKQVTEKKTLELYAADSGVEEALSYLSQLVGNWSVAQGPDPWRRLGNPQQGYYYERKTPPPASNELVINGKTVELVRVERVESEESQYYKITSTATSADEGSTTVTSYVEFLNFSCFFDSLITTSGDVNTDQGKPHEMIGRNSTAENYTGLWPTAEQLKQYYGEQVTDSGPPYDYDLDVAGNFTIPEEGLYSDVGENEFDIKNTGAGGAELRLEGTVYIKGNLELGKPPTNPFTVDLNKQTIFVEGTINVYGSCSYFSGSGCIIALGAIDFAPAIASDPNEFLFVMSLETVEFHPNPDFNGAIAAKGDVKLRTGGSTYALTDPPDGLNFLLGGTDAPITILSWQIS